MMRVVPVFCTLLLIITTMAATAQPNIPPDPPSAAVPITGIEWLLVAGGLFGARKVYKGLRNR